MGMKLFLNNKDWTAFVLQYCNNLVFIYLSLNAVASSYKTAVSTSVKFLVSKDNVDFKFQRERDPGQTELLRSKLEFRVVDLTIYYYVQWWGKKVSAR